MNNIWLILAVVFVIILICVIGMSINIWLRKNGKFPEYEVGHNKEMRKRGIKCINQQEREAIARVKRKKDLANYSHDCDSCMPDCFIEEVKNKQEKK